MNDAQIPTEYILIVYVVTLPCPSSYDYDILDKSCGRVSLSSGGDSRPVGIRASTQAAAANIHKVA